MEKEWRITFGVFFIIIGVFICLMPVVTSRLLQILVGTGGIILGTIDIIFTVRKSKNKP